MSRRVFFRDNEAQGFLTYGLLLDTLFRQLKAMGIPGYFPYEYHEDMSCDYAELVSFFGEKFGRIAEQEDDANNLSILSKHVSLRGILLDRYRKDNERYIAARNSLSIGHLKKVEEENEPSWGKLLDSAVEEDKEKGKGQENQGASNSALMNSFLAAVQGAHAVDDSTAPEYVEEDDEEPVGGYYEDEDPSILPEDDDEDEEGYSELPADEDEEEDSSVLPEDDEDDEEDSSVLPDDEDDEEEEDPSVLPEDEDEEEDPSVLPEDDEDDGYSSELPADEDDEEYSSELPADEDEDDEADSSVLPEDDEDEDYSSELPEYEDNEEDDGYSSELPADDDDDEYSSELPEDDEDDDEYSSELPADEEDDGYSSELPDDYDEDSGVLPDDDSAVSKPAPKSRSYISPMTPYSAPAPSMVVRPGYARGIPGRETQEAVLDMMNKLANNIKGWFSRL